jgi:hypothetical protein
MASRRYCGARRRNPEPTKPTIWAIYEMEPNVRGSGKSKPAQGDREGPPGNSGVFGRQSRNATYRLAARVQRRWPHRVRGGARSQQHSAAKALSNRPDDFALRRYSRRIAISFAAQDPYAFCDRFGGERVATPDSPSAEADS